MKLISDEFEVLVRNALSGVLQKIDNDGLVQNVSDGTPMGEDLDFYRRIPDVPTPYGQALASLFLIEMRQSR